MITREMLDCRLNWNIYNKNSCVAVFKPTGHSVVARTMEELNSKINKLIKELADKECDEVYM